MSRITITLHIDIPEAARVATPDVEYVAEPPHIAELAEQVFGEDEIVREPKSAAKPHCPDHRVEMKMVPAGTSKKTGKPYKAFWACPATGCDKTRNVAADA